MLVSIPRSLSLNDISLVLPNVEQLHICKRKNRTCVRSTRRELKVLLKLQCSNFQTNFHVSKVFSCGFVCVSYKNHTTLCRNSECLFSEECFWRRNNLIKLFISAREFCLPLALFPKAFYSWYECLEITNRFVVVLIHVWCFWG